MRVRGPLRRELVVVDVDAAHVVRELVDAFELLQRQRAQLGRHFDVLTEHDDVHRRGVYARVGHPCPGCRGTDGAGVRVAVAAATDAAPARRSTRAAAASVAPVVATSSTTRTCRARTEPCKEPRTRSPGPRPRARRPAPGLRGTRHRGRADRWPGPCMRARSRRARSSPWSTPFTRLRLALAGAHVTTSIARPARERAHGRRAQPRAPMRARCGTSRARRARARRLRTRTARPTSRCRAAAARRVRVASPPRSARSTARPRAARARAGEHHCEQVVDEPAERHGRTLRAAYDSFVAASTAAAAAGPPGARGSAASGRTAAVRSRPR